MLCDTAVLTVAMMKIHVFWDITLHQPLNIYQATWQNFSEDLNLVYISLWQIFFVLIQPLMRLQCTSSPVIINYRHAYMHKYIHTWKTTAQNFVLL